MREYHLSDWLPTTAKEVALRGWEQLDIIMFSADAYVDHPSFGSAVIGRLLEAQGYKIAIVPQPDWHGDFGISRNWESHDCIFVYLRE